MSEIRFAVRLLLKNPAFAVFTTLLLALGIGATTVLFTALDSVLLRPLPVRRPEELVRLVQHIPRVGMRSEFPYAFYESLGRDAQSFTAVFGSVELPVAVTEPAPAEQVRVDLVTPEFFESLGVPALYGRTLTRDDAKENPGMPPAVLSYSFWQRHFAGASSALGSFLVLHGHRFAVVGIMPREFNGVTVDTAPEVRVPVRALPLIAANSEGANIQKMEFELAARMRPGVTRERAQAECLVLWRPAMETFLKGFGDLSPKLIQDTLSRGMDVEPLERGVSVLREKYGAALQVLFASAGLLLLLVCANLAGLLLVRAAARTEEIAVRLALGATRGQLVRQLLVESGLLTLLGAAGGWMLAVAATPLLLNSLPPLRDAATRRMALALNVGPDRRVLLFSLAVATLTTILFGLAPALSASRTSLDAVLRGARSSGRWRGRQALVIGQVALCTLLLSGAALLVRTFEQLRTMNPGFDREHIVTFTADPALAGYKDQQALALQANLRARLRELPNVTFAATATIGILRGSGIKTTVAPAGQRVSRSDFMNTSLNGVSPEYFETMGMRLLEGRTLTEADAAQTKPRPVVVNQAFVRQFFAQVDPVGKRIGPEREGIAQPDSEIVGVVGDAKYRSLREPMTPTIYNLQRGVGPLQLIVQTKSRPEEVIRPVRQLMASLDPGLPFIEIHTVSEELKASTSGERLTAILASLFGAVAALLAGVGLYGVLAYAIVQRRREFGIRVALGACPADIGRLVGKQVLVMLTAGLLLGLASVFTVAPWLRSLLYGVSSWDLPSLAASVTLVALVIVAATFVPLGRATRIEPAQALREQ